MSTEAHGIARDQLRAFIERVERVEEEIATLNTDKSDIYKEARAVGFDVKVLRKVVAKRKLETRVREEQDAIFDMYWDALYGAPVHVHTHTRENIEENRRSDGGLSILTKHEDIRTPPVTAEEICRPANPAVSGGEPSIPSSDAGGEKMDGGCTPTPGRPDETSGHICAKSERATNSHSEKATVATQGEATEPTSAEREDRAAANAGGDHVTSIAKREVEFDRNPNTGEGDASAALPANGVKMEYCPPTGVKRSSFAHCFPEPSKDQRAALERDIIDNRVQVPIIRQGNVILDEWARYTIARGLGQSYPVKEYDGDDELLDVIEWQRASRNFTQAQEKKIAADLAKAMPDRADDIMAAFGLAEELEAAE